jgi:hypothetical protein
MYLILTSGSQSVGVYALNDGISRRTAHMLAGAFEHVSTRQAVPTDQDLYVVGLFEA